MTSDEEALGSAGIARILNKDVGRAASGMPVMLTKITEEDWEPRSRSEANPDTMIASSWKRCIFGLQMRCVLGLV